jgi:hypothetical protein
MGDPNDLFAKFLTTYARQFIAVRASEIPMKRMRFLWDGRIPLGVLAIIAGQGGIGKSTLTDSIIALVTRGELPGEHYGNPRNVLICASEESWESWIKPRLAAVGADMNRVWLFRVEEDERPGSLSLPRPEDLAGLEGLIQETEAALVVLSPLVSQLGRPVTWSPHRPSLCLKPNALCGVSSACLSRHDLVGSGRLRTRSGLVDGLDGESVVTGLERHRQLPGRTGLDRRVVVAKTLPVDDIRSARTTYPVIADPPVLVGAFQFAVAVSVPPVVPEVAVPITGAPGTVAGVTAAESAESGPVPAVLVAATWNRTGCVGQAVDDQAGCRRGGRAQRADLGPGAVENAHQVSGDRRSAVGRRRYPPHGRRRIAEVAVPIAGAAGTVAGVPVVSALIQWPCLCAAVGQGCFGLGGLVVAGWSAFLSGRFR